MDKRVSSRISGRLVKLGSWFDVGLISEADVLSSITKINGS